MSASTKATRKGRPPGGGTRGRIDALVEALTGPSVLRLKDAARVLGVSEMTVRRDVAAVPERFSYLGGSIVPRTANGPHIMAEQQGAHVSAKSAVCARGAAMVEEGDTIFVDCGTTLPHLARHLPADRAVTVLCYALNVAVPFSTMPNIRLIVLGGLFNPFSVDDGLATLDRLRIGTAFVSAGGVRADEGVSCFNLHEIAVKQAALRRAVQTCLVVDGSKFGKVTPAPFATLSSLDALITVEAPDAAAGDGAVIRIVVPGQFPLANPS